MAATGSHPAIKLKKHIQLPPDQVNGRRPSNPQSQPDSTSTLGPPDHPVGYNPARRRSTYRPGGNSTNNMSMVTAAMNFRRMTRASLVPQEPMAKPTVRYENSYRMEPEEGTSFLPSKAQCQVQGLLEDHMKDMTYDPNTAGRLAEKIAEAVKDLVKGLNCPRYKLVTTVALGQCSNQGMETASRCLWDETKDNYATISHKSKSMFAVVTIFAVYFE